MKPEDTMSSAFQQRSSHLPTLRSLLQRVEAATGADKQLDAEIVATVLSKEPVTIRQSPFNGAWCAYVAGDNGKERLWPEPSPFREMTVGVTASVDAALALVEKALPGWLPDRLRWGNDDVAFEIIGPEVENVEGYGRTASLAILAAALTALIAQAEKAEVVA